MRRRTSHEGAKRAARERSEPTLYTKLRGHLAPQQLVRLRVAPPLHLRLRRRRRQLDAVPEAPCDETREEATVGLAEDASAAYERLRERLGAPCEVEVREGEEAES